MKNTYSQNSNFSKVFMESNFCDLSPILLISTTNTFFFLSTLSFFFLSTLPCIFKQYSSHLPNNLSYTIYSQQQQNKTKLQNKTRFKIIEVRCNKYIIYMHRYIDTCFTDKKIYRYKLRNKFVMIYFKRIA